MSNDERLAKIEKLLEAAAARDTAAAEREERLLKLLTAGHGKTLDQHEKKSIAWLL